MAKAEWGLKRLCAHCGTRYYDMKKKPPVCPSCGTVYDPESLMKARRGRANAEDRAAKKAAAAEVIDDLPLVDGDDSEDAAIEDADELSDEDVDVDAVVEGATEEEDAR